MAVVTCSTMYTFDTIVNSSLYFLLFMKNSVHTDFNDSKHCTTFICSLKWHSSFNSVLIDGIYYG